VAAIILLLYWIFAYTVNEVFELRIFRENISETFALSVMGIIALMGGALIINVMFNLTRIAQKLNNDEQKQTLKSSKKFMVILILGFPLIAGLMLLGNHLNNKKKENICWQQQRVC
jgi:Na+-driven multidrug efflux pump